MKGLASIDGKDEHMDTSSDGEASAYDHHDDHHATEVIEGAAPSQSCSLEESSQFSKHMEQGHSLPSSTLHHNPNHHDRHDPGHERDNDHPQPQQRQQRQQHVVEPIGIPPTRHQQQHNGSTTRLPTSEFSSPPSSTSADMAFPYVEATNNRFGSGQGPAGVSAAARNDIHGRYHGPTSPATASFNTTTEGSQQQGKQPQQQQHQESSNNATSSFFLPTNASKLAPHTNEPSSVSVNYNSMAGIGGGSGTASWLPSSSTSSRYGPYSGSYNSMNSTSPHATTTTAFAKSSPRGGSPTAMMVDSADSTTPTSSVRPAFPGQQRMSLLTSRLNSAGASANDQQAQQAPQQPVTLPHPSESRRHSSVSYSSDPHLFSTSNGSSFHNSFQHQHHFFPHPSSTTTTVSTATAAAPESSMSGSSLASSNSFNRRHYQHYYSFPQHSATPTTTATNQYYSQPSANNTTFASSSVSQSPMAVDSISATSPDENNLPNNHSSIPIPAPSKQGPPLPYQPSLHSNSSLARTPTSSTPPAASVSRHLDIPNHPVPDVLVMLTSLLQKIIDANDSLQAQNVDSNGQPIQHQSAPPDDSRFSANVLAFHGRNIPAIGLHAYLTRILKYCPATNEVFISLLVYFDRIAQRANHSTETPVGGAAQSTNSNLFVIDSYNIHRLIIAGVTVASKFFSDVFYKNSRYAKVGGLPVEELNHLELQVLLLLDFRLMVPLEELQRYGDLLLKFWMKEQGHQAHADHQPSSQHQAQPHQTPMAATTPHDQ